MRKTACAGAAASLLLGSSNVCAQNEAPGVEVGAPSTAPASPSCRLTDHAGVDDADAQTSAQLVCAEIARVRREPDARYQVSLGKLGSIVILSVHREGSAPDSIADSREMRLQNIEEVSVAAPRLADAIVHGTPVQDTQRVDNLLGDETRQPKKKSGSMHFALGIVGMAPPLDRGLSPAPGLVLELLYDSTFYEIGASARFGGGAASSTAPDPSFFIFSVDGRYFMSESDVSPYVGAGLSYGYLNLKFPDENFQGDNGGLGTFGEAGVEILRTHQTHLSFGARLDVPFFSITFKDRPNGGAAGSTRVNYYYAPLSIELRLTI